MIAVACLYTVALIAAVFLLLRHFAEAQAQWALERRELLNRIQHPERPVVDLPADFQIPDGEPDDSHLVGTIEQLPED